MTRLECCMCGDYGFSDELFQCKACHFRSQHRYCSNLYPKAESYRVCNWCLTQEDISSDAAEQKLSTQNSSYSSKSDVKSEDINKLTDIKNRSQRRHADLAVHVSGSEEKHRSSAVRRRIITRGALEAKLRRTSSEDVVSSRRNVNNEIISHNNNSGITRHVFRTKVRRYKLLDEVSS